MPTALISLVLKYGKYLLPLITAVAIYFYASHRLDLIKSQSFEAGKTAAAIDVQKAFEVAMVARDKRIKELEAQTADYEIKLAASEKARTAKETVIKDRIEEKLKDVPDCHVDQSLIDDLNKLRAVK